jgi:hypothetical protein
MIVFFFGLDEAAHIVQSRFQPIFKIFAADKGAHASLPPSCPPIRSYGLILSAVTCSVVKEPGLAEPRPTIVNTANEGKKKSGESFCRAECVGLRSRRPELLIFRLHTLAR